MGHIIFTDSNLRVVGHGQSSSYTEKDHPTGPGQFFVGDSFSTSNLMTVYNPETKTYTADEVTEAYHNPPPEPVEEPAP